MHIRITSLLEGARNAQGTVVIVDVFRAFTTASVALKRGVAKIIFVADPQEALSLKERRLADFCVGEVGGIPPPGFDFGNSPFELNRADIEGKTMVQSTRAGAVGVNAAIHAMYTFGASLINARATVKALQALSPEIVTIVAMGLEGQTRTDEDELCALYLRNLLEGREPDAEAVRRLIEAGGEIKKFQDPLQPHFHPEDAAFALRANNIDRAIRIQKKGGLLVAENAEGARRF